MTKLLDFTYKKNDMLEIKTNQGMEIYFSFDKGEIELLGFDGTEFTPEEELLGSLFVSIGDEMINLVDLCNRASYQFDSIVADVEEEQDEEAKLEEYVRTYR